MNIAIFVTILLSIIAAIIFSSVAIEDRGTVSVAAYILAAISVLVMIIAILTYIYNRLSIIIASWFI